MDYWVAFYEKTEVMASFIIEECPSEVVALSEAMGRLREGTGGMNVWVISPERRIMICQLSEEDKRRKLEDEKPQQN